MAVVNFLSADGKTHTITIEPGGSIMQAAIQYGIEGIDALCGGFCSCATCHVYVDPAWIRRLSSVSEDEDAMLDGALAERQPESRLSCQIQMTEELDGISVRIPSVQS